MPTYGYKCTQCGFQFQVVQKMSDSPVKICPECEGEVKRLLYPVGVVFKGSGWYVNDSRAPEKSEGSEKGESKNTEPASDTKTDAKADSSPETKSESPAKTEPSAPAASAPPPSGDNKPAS